MRNSSLSQHHTENELAPISHFSFSLSICFACVPGVIFFFMLTKRPSEIHPFLPRRSLLRCAAAGACVEARASPAAPMPVGTEPPTEPPVDPVPPPASPDRQSRPEAPTVGDGDSSEGVPESPPPYLAAGVLPFCILGGDLLFLLGQQLRFRSHPRGTSTSFPKTRGASTPAAAGGATTKGQGSGASGAPVKSPSTVSVC